MKVIRPTTLNFIYVRDKKEKLCKYFDSVELLFAGKKYDFNSSNCFEFYIELEENHIYYKETISFKTKTNLEISADYPIYAYKINNIYIDIHKYAPNNVEKIESISVEILYQTIMEKLLPNTISYDNKELLSFDTFENKYRKRIGLINIDPKKLQLINEILKIKKYENFKFIDEYSYEIIVRIPSNNDIQYSIADLDNINIDGLKTKTQKSKGISEKQSLLELLLKFKEDFFSVLKEIDIKKIKTKLNAFNSKFTLLKISAVEYYENISNYCNFDEIDIDIFIQFFYYLEYLKAEILKDSDEDDDYKEELQDFLTDVSDFNEKYEKLISEIRVLNIEIKDKLFLIKSYNKKFIESLISKIKIEFIQTLNVEKIDESNSYKKAINFVKQIIENLNEDSRLFEIFLYLDSHVIENLLEKNDILKEEFIDNYGKKKIIEYKEHPTEYGINMSTVDEVKNHLNKLMPKYIIRLNTEMKFNATYDDKTKIMFINEKKLFNHNSKFLTRAFDDKNLNEKYALPISIEILHELCAHGKMRLFNDKIGSPEENRDSKNDYHRFHVNKKIDQSKKIKFPESGVLLENYISKNKKIIRWLKKVHKKEEIIKEIMNVEYWIGKDFEKLESLVENYIKSEEEEISDKNNLFTNEMSKNDEEEIIISDDDDTCGFHKYE